MYIDIHTHNNDGRNAIKSVHAHDYLSSIIPQKQFFTTGVHPWFADSDLTEKIINHLKNERHNRLIGLGECGLDRVKGPELAIQKEVFERHLLFASEYNLPVIIHQVKTISDLMPYLKKYDQLSYIFHGYNGNEQQTHQLLEYDVYFSFGLILEKQIDKINKSVEAIPMEKIFLETDESDIDIADLYKNMANLKNVPVSELEEAVEQNFMKIFKRSIDELD